MKAWYKRLFDSVAKYSYRRILHILLWQQVKTIDELFFCGFRIMKWVEDDGFERFANWTGMGICHELAALMMIVLKENETAVLYQGYDYDNKGKLTKHAWVEFKIPLFGWFACDLMWLGGCAKREKYREWFPRRTVRWRCTHSEFWQIEFSHFLYQQMQQPETSYVMDGLTLYVPYNGADCFGFNQNVQKIRSAALGIGCKECMLPVKIGNEIGWVTTLRDFARNPKAKKPRMRSIRLARRAYKDMQIAIEKHQSIMEAENLIDIGQTAS